MVSPRTSNSFSQADLHGVRLGKSGLKVSKIILGLMSYGSPEWLPWVQGEEVGLEHIKFAYDNGIQVSSSQSIFTNVFPDNFQIDI